jgi:hypothetical protein
MSEQIKHANEFIEKFAEIACTQPGRVSLALHVDGQPVLNAFPNRKMRMRSVQKLPVAAVFAREAASNPEFAKRLVNIADVDKVNTLSLDLGAHEIWKRRMGNKTHVTMTEIAEGMMQESSNAYTQYMINHLGPERINTFINEYGLQHMDPCHSNFLMEAFHPFKGSAGDTITMMENISTKEKSGVKAIFESIVGKATLTSAEHGTGTGFAKGGSYERPGIFRALSGPMYDRTEALCMQHNGKRVSTALFLNHMDPGTKAYMEERLVPFLCESTCNAGFRQRCTQLLEKGAERFVGLAQKTIMHGHLRF